MSQQLSDAIAKVEGLRAALRRGSTPARELARLCGELAVAEAKLSAIKRGYANSHEQELITRASRQNAARRQNEQGLVEAERQRRRQMAEDAIGAELAARNPNQRGRDRRIEKARRMVEWDAQNP